GGFPLAQGFAIEEGEFFGIGGEDAGGRGGCRRAGGGGARGRGFRRGSRGLGVGFAGDQGCDERDDDEGLAKHGSPDGIVWSIGGVGKRVKEVAREREE